MGERCYLFKNLFLEIYFKTCYLRKEKPVSLVFGPGAMGKPRGSRWGGRWEGGSGWGTRVNPWLFHFNVWQNPLQIKIKKKNTAFLCHCSPYPQAISPCEHRVLTCAPTELVLSSSTAAWTGRVCRLGDAQRVCWLCCLERRKEIACSE